MKGAHSIKKKRKGGKIAAIVILIIVVLAFVGTGIYFEFARNHAVSNFAKDFISSITAGHDTEATEGALNDTEAQAQAQPAGDPVSGSYKNERFGYEMTIPSGFTMVSKLEDNAGIRIENRDLDMNVEVKGYNNSDRLDTQAILSSLWNHSEDSIGRSEGNRVIIYQYDDKTEYFYWIYVGEGSIDQLEISYPLQDDNAAELAAAQELMSSFISGDTTVAH